MGKIDQHTVVPVGWFLSGMGAVIAFVIVATVWVSRVDMRLQRIEEKLHIPPLVSSGDMMTMVDKAMAGGR